MKTTLGLIFWAICPILLSAQAIDYKKIILPDDATNVTFEEKLVQLAWRNNPSSHIAQEEVTVSREEFKITRSEWSTLLGVTGNLNEFNIKALTNTDEDGTGGNLFFPRYNVFLRIPLSYLVTTPHQKYAARARVRMSEEKVNLLKLEMRKTVLKLYNEYKKAELIRSIRKETMADEESNYLLVEQKFKNGDALIEDYIKAQRSRNDLKIQLAYAENEFQSAKLDLEEVIGMKIEDVN